MHQARPVVSVYLVVGSGQWSSANSLSKFRKSPLPANLHPVAKEIKALHLDNLAEEREDVRVSSLKF